MILTYNRGVAGRSYYHNLDYSYIEAWYGISSKLIHKILIIKHLILVDLIDLILVWLHNNLMVCLFGINIKSVSKDLLGMLNFIVMGSYNNNLTMN